MTTEEIRKAAEKWQNKHSELLSEYSKGNSNNEVMRLYRSYMKDVLDFIKEQEIKDKEIEYLKTQLLQHKPNMFDVKLIEKDNEIKALKEEIERLKHELIIERLPNSIVDSFTKTKP